MRLSCFVCAALIAASPALARDKKKTAPPAPVAAPAAALELDDPHMAEELGEACLAAPPELETYDSRDNVFVARAGESRAFFHLKGACTANVMIFADTIAAEDGSQCVKPGGKLVFTSSYGDKVVCTVVRINRWLDDEPIVDD